MPLAERRSSWPTCREPEVAEAGSAVPRRPQSLVDAIRCFPTLPVPASLPVGSFRAELYGPQLFQLLARAGLAIGVLRPTES